MEARQTLRGSAVPKGLIVVLAVSAAIGLAIGASAVSKGLVGSGATQSTTVHAAPGTVLRQDAGAAPSLLDRGAERQGPQAATAAKQNGRSGGTQSIEDKDASAAPRAGAVADPELGLTHGYI